SRWPRSSARRLFQGQTSPRTWSPGRFLRPLRDALEDAATDDDGDHSSRRQRRPHRRASPLQGRKAGARAIGPRHCMVVRCADRRASFGDQHLPVDLDDPAVFHQPQSQHVLFADALVGLDNVNDILTDEDVWARLQTTASFVIWSVALQVVIGFGLALLINRQFRSHSFWTTIILLPMMLSPAVVGNFWTLLLQPQIGPFNYVVGLFTG